MPVIYEPFPEYISVDYQSQGDQWIELLVAEIKNEIDNVNGYSISYKTPDADFRYPHWDMNLNGNSGIDLRTPSIKLVPVKTDDESVALYIALASENDMSESEKNLWKVCIGNAVEKLAEESPSFNWSAALGQSDNPSTYTYALKSRRVTHDITIRSGGRQHISTAIKGTPYFGSYGFTITYPVVIEGRSKGYNWMVAASEAGKKTHRIAALISLAWDSTWILLDSPRPLEPGTLKIPYGGFDGKATKPQPNYPKTVKTLPSWIDGAWDRIDSDEALMDAVNAYYQGLLLTDSHPSFALIAFISSVEIIGRTITGEKCACCGRETGSNQRFRAGVDAIVKDGGQAKILYQLYKSRSVTAHEGKLHANEDILGMSPFPSIFKEDSKRMFVHADLRKIRELSRKLLIKALRGKIKP